MNIEELINQPESKTLEFKQDLSSLQPVIKTLIAFANTAGGILVIGRTNDGVIVGIDDVFAAEEKLANSVANNILPLMAPEINVVTIQGKNLLVVKIEYWKGPFYYKKQGIPGGVYVRIGSTSQPTSPELLRELQRTAVSPSYDQEPITHLTKDSLDLPKIESLFKKVGKEATEDKLRSLGILASTGNGHLVPSVGGLIMFGRTEIREQLVYNARVRCARFLGTSKAKILDQFDPEGSILDAVTAVQSFIARNTRLAAQFGGMQRVDIPEYPVGAIREVLINALVHSDYSVTGCNIQVAIFDDRLEIQSPGMLPLGFTLEDFKRGVSHVRNKVIVRAFHELKFMEQWGSGYKRIVEDCITGSYPEPTWEELGLVVRVTFRPHQATFPTYNFPDLVLQETPAIYQRGVEQPPAKEEDLLDRQLSVLKAFGPTENISFRELTKRVPLIPARTLHYDLAQLRDKGFIMSRGKGRAVVWRRVR
ncbi:MAG: ATP-binding protein [Chlamydiales bacterium]|nr:ATP-binding protein [Chlamydiales bacterium]